METKTYTIKYQNQPEGNVHVREFESFKQAKAFFRSLQRTYKSKTGTEMPVTQYCITTTVVTRVTGVLSC